MSNENPVYVNELVVTFEGDDQNNVSWEVRADESVTKSLHASFDELAQAGAPLSVMGIRALYEILCENMGTLALEKGNLERMLLGWAPPGDDDADARAFTEEELAAALEEKGADLVHLMEYLSG